MTHHRRRLIEDAVAAGLSLRQAECLASWSEGRTMEQVAHELGISLGTVKVHLASARLTLDASTTASMLVIVAYRKAA